MRLDKEKALKLRLQGRSYSEIQQLLGVPKATLSAWFSGLDIPDAARERIKKRVYEKSIAGLIKRNHLQTHLAEQSARSLREKAKREVIKLSKKDIFLIGIALYWAEGYKRPRIVNGKMRTSHSVSMTNSDPALMKTFLRFLREVCLVPEERITANLRIYEHQNANYLLDFWSKATNIPPSKFQKFYYGISKSSLGKRPFNVLPYGTIQVRVNDTKLYHKIMGWIEGMASHS